MLASGIVPVGDGHHEEVPDEDEAEAGPEPEAVASVDPRLGHETVQATAEAGHAAVPPVEHATHEVPEGVAGGDVHRQKEGFRGEHDGPHVEDEALRDAH